MATNRKNLAAGIVANNPGTTGTTILLESGYGQTMPDVPFSMTTTPPGELSTMGNSEIVEVTARTGDTLTVTRATRGTTAQDVEAGWPIANGVYVEDKIPSDRVDFKTRTVLYSGNGLFNTTIPLSESWQNFDQLIILASQNQTGVTARASSAVIDVPTWMELNGSSTSYVQLIANTGGGTSLSHKVDVNLSSNGGMTINSTAIDSTPYYIRSVVGLKFLGG